MVMTAATPAIASHASLIAAGLRQESRFNRAKPVSTNRQQYMHAVNRARLALISIACAEAAILSALSYRERCQKSSRCAPPNTQPLLSPSCKLATCAISRRLADFPPESSINLSRRYSGGRATFSHHRRDVESTPVLQRRIIMPRALLPRRPSPSHGVENDE